MDIVVSAMIDSPFISLVCDGPSWEMTLTDADGKRYQCGGCMWADPEVDGFKLSEHIRALLAPIFIEREYSLFDPSKMALFDGTREKED